MQETTTTMFMMTAIVAQIAAAKAVIIHAWKILAAQ